MDPVLNARVIALAHAIGDLDLPGVVDVVPTFRSVTVHYDCRRIRGSVLQETIGALAMPDARGEGEGQLVEIPVCYGGSSGPDLEVAARELGMTAEGLAARHGAVDYRVYMLGFLPGFAYLGDLPADLRLPRLGTPRTRVPWGAVAIADGMTAVYPSVSPGGWRLIGRTPWRLFDSATGRALLQPGDRVRFAAISVGDFEAMPADEVFHRHHPERPR